jgi:hypothetical protein
MKQTPVVTSARICTEMPGALRSPRRSTSMVSGSFEVSAWVPPRTVRACIRRKPLMHSLYPWWLRKGL